MTSSSSASSGWLRDLRWDLGRGLSREAKGSGSESEESRAGREKAEEPEAREVGFEVEDVDLRVPVDAVFALDFLIEEEVRGGLKGFGGIFEDV